MLRINVLSPGFTTPNGRAFLFPLVVWRKELHDLGFDVRIYRHVHRGLTRCDVLLVDSKFHRSQWRLDAPSVLSELRSFSGQCRVVFCDTGDSAGLLLADVLSAVHVYAKSQVLLDRSGYAKPLYGHRVFSDYYHRAFGVADTHPVHSEAVTDPALLSRLRVSWNSGLADYSLFGPARMAAYRHLQARPLLRFPKAFTPPCRYRPVPVSARFGTAYSRDSVAAQRKMIARALSASPNTKKLARPEYYRELRHSKVVLSPFGYGEITLKDFEVFLTGGLLVKPDMRNIETWPDFFRDGETILTHRWDLSDLNEVIERALGQYEALRLVAETGQACYRNHTAGPNAPRLFAEHLSGLIASICVSDGT